MTERKETSSGGMERREPGCSSYGEEDFVRYLGKAMTGPEAERFEAHADKCDECLRMLYRCQVERERQKDEEFARRSMTLHDRFGRAKTGNLLEIVARASGKLLELVSTTGELLRTPTFVPARGESAAEERAEPLRIMQEFGTPPISLQASLERCRKEGCLDLKISVYDREEEEFMPGIAIELAGPEILEEMTTDEDGEVSFRIERKGEYKVNLSSGARRIGEISLTVEMG
ncbi:hypothetical protein KP003_14245 [Geomonas nitrogeniifigens]|uniref:hypothetical protein n=1 Tax=Geomonas diazotrophica TaxID=2843197 RepID=UPI001C2B856D|nr:hypothetical protein [Geomonas nitrogeniifigens]QXE85537.1 hypothetical protein KP003_14245 [Geomonas nitrogeniifigens]